MKNKKRKLSEEHKQHIADALEGRTLTKKTRAAMRKAKKNVPKSSSHRKNIALAMKELWAKRKKSL